MTARKLRDILKQYDDDAVVKVSSDPEGNEIRDLHEVSVENHGPKTPPTLILWPL